MLLSVPGPEHHIASSAGCGVRLVARAGGRQVGLAQTYAERMPDSGRQNARINARERVPERLQDICQIECQKDC